MMKNHIDAIMPIRSPRKIEFDRANEEKAFRILMLSKAPVRIIGKKRYVVSNIHCNLLKEKGIKYKIIRQH